MFCVTDTPVLLAVQAALLTTMPLMPADAMALLRLALMAAPLVDSALHTAAGFIVGAAVGLDPAAKPTVGHVVDAETRVDETVEDVSSAEHG